MLDEYNADKSDSEKIVYTDSMALMVDNLNRVVATIKYVLMCYLLLSVLVL